MREAKEDRAERAALEAILGRIEARDRITHLDLLQAQWVEKDRESAVSLHRTEDL
jgi:hypothetical protein